VSHEPGLTLDAARERGQGSAHLDADPTYARRFVRKVSPRLSWAIVRWTGLAADHITYASIASGVVGGLLVGVGSLWFDIGAVILLQLAYLLDVADGEVARIRGSAGKRGTYLDLIGHVLQNRALYAGASISLLIVTDRAWWAIAVALVTLAFAIPFGHYARMQVVGAPAANPEHGGRQVAGPRRPGVFGAIHALYRGVAFVWNYPASMNLFCAALLLDIVRFVAGAEGALAVPVLIVLFGPSLAAKHILHAISVLRRKDW
jgi:phosphatidylglycerophosphate synthase